MIYTINPTTLLKLFFHHIYHLYYGYIIEPVVIIDPIAEYINKTKTMFLKTYEIKKNMNENIEPLFYNKKDYTIFMKMDKNEIETAWKTRILYENTPKGSIVMFYDAYKQAFTYYTDQTSIPITILNAVAMKYVIRFFCRDFYQDEQTLKIIKAQKDKTEQNSNVDIEEKEKEEEEEEEEEFVCNTYISPLIKIHNEKEETDETKKLKKILDEGPFVKFKSNITLGDKNEKNDKKKKIIADINVNRFVSLGKMYNFHILQKKSSITTIQTNTSYADMFNNSKAKIISTKMGYKDFKQSKQQLNID